MTPPLPCLRLIRLMTDVRLYDDAVLISRQGTQAYRTFLAPWAVFAILAPLSEAPQPIPHHTIWAAVA